LNASRSLAWASAHSASAAQAPAPLHGFAILTPGSTELPRHQRQQACSSSGNEQQRGTLVLGLLCLLCLQRLVANLCDFCR
jgi:hypothetical protein